MQDPYPYQYHCPRYLGCYHKDEKVIKTCYLSNRDYDMGKMAFSIEASPDLVKDYITQYSVTCIYFSMPQIPAFIHLSSFA